MESVSFKVWASILAAAILAVMGWSSQVSESDAISLHVERGEYGLEVFTFQKTGSRHQVSEEER